LAGSNCCCLNLLQLISLGIIKCSSIHRFTHGTWSTIWISLWTSVTVTVLLHDFDNIHSILIVCEHVQAISTQDFMILLSLVMLEHCVRIQLSFIYSSFSFLRCTRLVHSYVRLLLDSELLWCLQSWLRQIGGTNGFLWFLGEMLCFILLEMLQKRLVEVGRDKLIHQQFLSVFDSLCAECILESSFFDPILEEIIRRDVKYYLLSLLCLSQGSAFSLGLQQVSPLHARRLLSMIDLVDNAILPLFLTRMSCWTWWTKTALPSFCNDMSTFVVAK